MGIVATKPSTSNEKTAHTPNCWCVECEPRRRAEAIAPELYAFVAAMTRVPCENWSLAAMQEMARRFVAEVEGK